MFVRCSALGVAELVTHLDEPVSLVFWVPTLFGGGALVLLGVFRLTAPAWRSILLVSTGAAAASLATAWTLVLPLVAVVLVVLVVRVRSGPATPAAV
ncbi:MAG TPA: hypothetical protein VF073_06900 [Gaiella sp.]